jgi:DNA-binding beta-propeller fold protein YncE
VLLLAVSASCTPVSGAGFDEADAENAPIANLVEEPSSRPAPRTVYVTNRDSNDVSAFTVADDGRLRLLQAGVPAAGEPRGIAIAPSGRYAYVANTTGNSVSVYPVAAGGRLGEPSSSAPTGGSPFGIAIAPSGRSLYVGNSEDGTVSVFAVEGDGTLSAPTAVDAGDADGFTRAVAVTPDGRFVFASNASTVSTFAVGPHGDLQLAGNTSALLAPDEEASPFGLTITPDGRFLYVAVQGDTTVPVERHLFAFRIGGQGQLLPVAGSPFPAARLSESLSVTPDGRTLYLTSPFAPNFDGVLAYRIDADGTPRSLGQFAAGTGAVGIAVAPGGQNLYVSNFISNDASAFRIEALAG